MWAFLYPRCRWAGHLSRTGYTTHFLAHPEDLKQIFLSESALKMLIGHILRNARFVLIFFFKSLWTSKCKIFRLIIFICENSWVYDLCSLLRPLTLERNPSDFTRVPDKYKCLTALRTGHHKLCWKNQPLFFFFLKKKQHWYSRRLLQQHQLVRLEENLKFP